MSISIVNWGLISFEKALQLQQELVKKVQLQTAPSTLVFCEYERERDIFIKITIIILLYMINKN